MLQSKENQVRIEGILSEIDITQATFTKNGKVNECLRGTLKIQVAIDDEVLEIPVQMFASATKKDGQPNPAYASLMTVKNEYISIAAGGIDKADRVLITGASLNMNEYYNANGAFVSFPRIQGSFIKRVKKEEFKPEASFGAIFTVGSITPEVDREGVETGRLIIKGILPQYGGTVDVIPFYAKTPSVVEAIKNYWDEGDTVKAVGKLNFTSTTETITVEVDFGEPTTQTKTTNISELLIIGGSSSPLDGDNAFDQDEIKQALAERKAALEEKKIQAEKKKKADGAPAATAGANKYADLGF